MLAPSLFGALKVKYPHLKLGSRNKLGEFFPLWQYEWAGDLVGLFSFSPKNQVLCMPLQGWGQEMVELPVDSRDCSHSNWESSPALQEWLFWLHWKEIQVQQSNHMAHSICSISLLHYEFESDLTVGLENWKIYNWRQIYFSLLHLWGGGRTSAHNGRTTLKELLEILSQGAKKSLVRKLAFSQICISHSHKSTVPSVPLRKTLTIKSVFKFKVQTWPNFIAVQQWNKTNSETSTYNVLDEGFPNFFAKLLLCHCFRSSSSDKLFSSWSIFSCCICFYPLGQASSFELLCECNSGLHITQRDLSWKTDMWIVETVHYLPQCFLFWIKTRNRSEAQAQTRPLLVYVG